MNPARILLIHPEPSILALMASMLQSSGYQIDEASDERAAVRRLERGGVDVILAGADPSDPDSLELLSLSRRKYPRVPFLLLFPGQFPDRAREAMRMGAASVLRFPLPANELRAAVTQACESSSGPYVATGGSPNGSSYRAHGDHRSTSDSGSKPTSPVGPGPGPNSTQSEPAGAAFAPTMLGEDSMLRQSIELASTVAPTRASVVIVGEQGTGKTLLARAIHQRSGRRDQPFIEVACAGVDEFLLERDLFGQKFEGVETTERPGFLERANRGTILFDEIAMLPIPLQDRLLAVLRDGEYTPMGSSRSIPIDVRFLFATRENLPALVEQGKFRRELFERIGDVCLKLPPLRQRGKDILRLAEIFRERFAREYNKPAAEFSPEAIDTISRHDWPGNVRELETVIQRGVAMSQGARVTAVNLAIGILPMRSSRSASYAPRPGHQQNLGLRPLKQALEEPEKQIIIQTLRALNWNRQDTARVLDINRTTLYKKMKKYGLLMEMPALLN